MQSWVGHHKSSLIQSWGPPSNITTDGKGKYIYIITIEIYLRIPKLHITPSQALIIPQQLTILILPKECFL